MPDPSRLARQRDEDDSQLILGVLNAVHANSQLTQRSIARELGIALGLANTYLKRCARKGLIKIAHAPARRYAYYLTPKGFSEKAHLTAEYLAYSFGFFRRARNQCDELLALAAERGWQKLALAGAGDLAEIATLCAREYPVTIVGVIDPAFPGDQFAGLSVAPTRVAFGDVEAVIVTDLKTPQATWDALTGLLPPGRVLAPKLLHIRPPGTPGGSLQTGDAT
ncbi:MAG: winged helix-turn-helix transcriptional regulator [Rhodospirillales bacterium]|nr:winged helix-turn-helix transcriptional regulator [Rhodospirillales bacterium]